ncbi:MAG: alanine--tRNA ligase, partial [Polyangia bacterium]|nr:alanine--tRNA ligase [Polyangia bacterium]
MPTANEIRKRFLSFFEARGHRLVPSAPVVPHGDPTLLFTNAGMNQFKDVFLGTGARDYTRAADTQKCIRVSGKHNDLDEVGADTYHHTFFEMLGNWSFGDYFKEDAIRWAWEFLVDEMGLDRDKLWATVFGGDEALALPPDEEAERLWPEVTDIPRARVLRFGRKENFWEMAETGPCGPCSEIHLDLGPGACDRSATPGHRCSVNGDCARFIEIWNLVFIQYQHMEDGSLRPLPARHVDTGMGFERLVSVVQGKTSNYDTDLFAPLLGRISELAGAPYGEDGRKDMAMRVVADHARTLSVAIADNVVPSNKDRGYVLRRILRRASRYGYQVLGLTEPFIHQVVPVVAEIFSEVFPEIAKRRDHIARVVEAEERAFLRTLERGVLLFEKAAGELAAAGAAVLDGAVAFRLYETYGFPRDLTELMCRERGFTLDEAGWARAEAAHVEASKGASGQRLDPGELEGLPPTRFVGYWELGLAGTLGHEAETRLLRLVDNEYLVLYESPFYAESGGQVGDTGLVVAPGFRFVVRDTQRVGDLSVHQGDLEAGDLAALRERGTAWGDL